MRKLRLCVCKTYTKNTASDGAWDGTWDEWYEYIIHNSEGEIVDQESGFQSKDKARKAGEERLKRLEERR